MLFCFYNILKDGIQKIEYTSFLRYFSEVYVGEISKRIILKNYKRNYNENGNSIVWDNIDIFKEKRLNVLNMIKATHPSLKLIKTDRKVNQSNDRKERQQLGMKMELIVKNNYIMTYEEFFEYFNNDISKKDVRLTWDSLSHIEDENEKYYKFLSKTFPLFMISRAKKNKIYATSEMVKEISLFLLEGDYSKEAYYRKIENFLILSKENKKHIVDLNKITTNASRNEIIEYYNRIKEENQNYSEYACMKKTLFNFCNGLVKGEDFKEKFKHVSPFYLDLMKFYFNYLLKNSE